MHFGMFMEMAESQIGQAVADCDLTDERSLVITRLLPSLAIRPPKIAWSSADYNCVDMGQNRWRHSLIVSVDDPSCTLWSIEWPYHDPAAAHFSAEPDSGMLIAVETIEADCQESSHRVFTNALERFKTNLLRAQLEFDRYNAALPYLISSSIDHKLNFPQAGNDDG